MNKEPNLLDKSGYFERHSQLCAEAKSYREAWEMLENELFEKYRIYWYASYDSFRNAKSRWQNKKSEKI